MLRDLFNYIDALALAIPELFALLATYLQWRRLVRRKMGLIAQNVRARRRLCRLQAHLALPKGANDANAS